MRCHFLCAAVFVASTVPANAHAAALPSPNDRIAPDKFIPSFAIQYGAAMPGAPVDELAKFDVLISAPGLNKRWADGASTSWQELKARNPKQLVFLYTMGPTEYNTASWGAFSDGWPWMVTNHGIGTADPWVARGLHANVMLQNSGYAQERLMLPGNPAWRTYWAENAYELAFTMPAAPGSAGADGVFADNTTAGNWITWQDVGTPTTDPPLAYSAADGTALDAKWRTDVLGALDVATPALLAHGVGLIPNYGGMGRAEKNWDALDALPSPPIMALQEDGFVSPYGSNVGGKATFHSWDVIAKIDELARMKKVRALMTNHGLSLTAPTSRDDALAQMATVDGNGLTGWDAFWYSIGVFLMGFDDVRGNGYLSFTIWGYSSRVIYFDELDPQHFHLGRAKAPYSAANDVLIREFDDGWVMVNPTLFTKPPGSIRHVAVPSGMARVVTHANLADPTTAPLVDAVDIPAGHAVVLLKPGHAIGDSDNHPLGVTDAGLEDGSSSAGSTPAPSSASTAPSSPSAPSPATPSSASSGVVSGCGCLVVGGASAPKTFVGASALGAFVLAAARRRRRRSSN